MAAGDLIVMHGEMIHSGTANAVDSAIRAYVSTFVTRVVSRAIIAGIWVAFFQECQR